MSEQYFAKINNENVVVHVAVVTAEFMAENPDRYSGTWVETFFEKEGKTYAGVGYIYDPKTKDFYLPEISEA